MNLFRKLTIGRVLIACVVLGFSILLFGGWHLFQNRAPVPGVTVDEVVAATGFELVVPDEVPESRIPTDEELRLLRDVVDPTDARGKEVPG